MFQGKMKALTFSYDDGVTQDRRLVEIFNRYGLKATFNLNSQRLGKKGELVRDGKIVQHNKVSPEEVKDLYAGHEVAVHTLTHPSLPSLDDAEVLRQVEEDRKNLEALVGYEVVGMAYPGGGVNNDERVAKIIREQTKIQYARTITSTGNFDLQDNLYQFNPSVYHLLSPEKLFEMGREFLRLQADKPQIFYIWGHSYELDQHNTWDMMEEFCKMMSGKDDIFYGTNRKILLQK